MLNLLRVVLNQSFPYGLGTSEPPDGSRVVMHFLLLGAVLFVAFAFQRDDGAPSQKQIVVSAGKIEHLAALFARTWPRLQTTFAPIRGCRSARCMLILNSTAIVLTPMSAISSWR
jgi:hypothetical protein